MGSIRLLLSNSHSVFSAAPKGSLHLPTEHQGRQALGIKQTLMPRGCYDNAIGYKTWEGNVT